VSIKNKRAQGSPFMIGGGGSGGSGGSGGLAAGCWVW
jgi:hypothetical protein